MTKRAPNFLLYFIAFCVLAFEAFVFSLTFAPKVPHWYQKYYITQESDCLPKENKKKYEIGERLDFRVDPEFKPVEGYLGCGWSDREDFGTWTVGKEATVWLSASEGYRDRLFLKGKGHAITGDKTEQKIYVMVNGDFVEVMSLNRETSVFSVPISGEAISDGRLKITFFVDNPVVPAEQGPSEDERELGLALVWLELAY